MHTNTSETSRCVCYVDITDIVHYAARNHRVTGIQRVQLNLIEQMVRRRGSDKLQCTFFHPDGKSIFAFDPVRLFDDDEFNANAMLRRLGLGNQSRLFPSKRDIRIYLRRYSTNKPRRLLAKAAIYLKSIFAPSMLEPMGLRRVSETELTIKPINLQRIQVLPPHTNFVLLGAHWAFAGVTEFSRKHAERGGSVIHLIHDLIPVVRPEFAPQSESERFVRWLREIINFTSRYACISNCTAEDLRRFLPETRDVELVTIPLAHEFAGFERFVPVMIEQPATIDAAAQPFVLCVGTLEVRKNGARLLQVWRRLMPTLGGELPRLVFAGKQGWAIDEFKSMLDADAELAKRVRILDSPTDREMAYLYQRCLFSIYPSMYEGWGLPVGEAAWFGKYVISSSTSSLPEVCGDLVDYIDPYDIDWLCTAVERALRDPEYVRRKEEAIMRSHLRRWEDVAVDLYEFISRPAPSPTHDISKRQELHPLAVA